MGQDVHERHEVFPVRTLHRSLSRGIGALLAVVVGAAADLPAQHPPLAPTSNVTIVVTGTLHYSSILVPAGVSVRFELPTGTQQPVSAAIVLCDGAATVNGTLDVSGWTSSGGRPPGEVSLGAGSSGSECWLPGFGFYYPPSGGAHAGAYGSALPFSLAGGSPGGSMFHYGGGFPSSCSYLNWIGWGGGGGGTLVLLAGGPIDIGGVVRANGGTGEGGGSGGSVLLRSSAGITIRPGATVDARGGWGMSSGTTYGDPGYIRFDAWASQPIVQGTVNPVPLVLELPHLRTQSPPSIGTAWILDIFAPENAPVYLAASPAPGNGASTPFGLLGIDLATASSLVVAAPQPSHDPVTSVTWTIPNAPSLIGLSLWVQALTAPNALPARLTNTIQAVVQ
jgi:hypothetical protein